MDKHAEHDQIELAGLKNTSSKQQPISSTPTTKRTIADRSPVENSVNKKSKHIEDQDTYASDSDSYSSATSTDETSMSEPNGDQTPAKEEKSSPAEVQLPGDDASIGEWGRFLFTYIQSSNNSMAAKLDNLSTKNESLNKQLTEENDYKEKTTTVITTIKSSVEKLITQYDVIRNENKELKERLIKLEYHARRNNLEINGIPERRYETDTDCYNKVLSELTKLFDDDVADPNEESKTVRSAKDKASLMVINRIHRNGHYIEGRNRPILFNLQWYGDKEYILNNKKSLNDGIYVNEDYPSEIKDCRRVLRPILKLGMQSSHYRGKISLRYDKLIVKGKAYSVGNLHELPADLNPEKLCQNEDTETNSLAFFGMHSPFSNFHFSPMKINGKRYTCVEQYFQAEKAACFDDDETHYKIVNTSNPFEIKKFGYHVKNFIQQQWDQRAEEIMFNGVLNKFCANEKLTAALASTGSKAIFEASRDPVWGCGMSLNDPSLFIKSAWKNDGGLMLKVYNRVKHKLGIK